MQITTADSGGCDPQQRIGGGFQFWLRVLRNRHFVLAFIADSFHLAPLVAVYLFTMDKNSSQMPAQGQKRKLDSMQPPCGMRTASKFVLDGAT